MKISKFITILGEFNEHEFNLKKFVFKNCRDIILEMFLCVYKNHQYLNKIAKVHIKKNWKNLMKFSGKIKDDEIYCVPTLVKIMYGLSLSENG